MTESFNESLKSKKKPNLRTDNQQQNVVYLQNIQQQTEPNNKFHINPKYIEPVQNYSQTQLPTIPQSNGWTDGQINPLFRKLVLLLGRELK